MSDNIRITVLISGNGSNLQALIDDPDNKLNSNGISSQIVRVISNRKGAYGLTRALNAGIPTGYQNYLDYKRNYPSDQEDRAREEYDRHLAELVLKDAPDLVICAGFMRILKPAFLDPLQQQDVAIINLHPALPGQYNGSNAIERAHADFMDGKIDRTGIMIHYVIAEVDMGEPIITQPIQLSHPMHDKVEDLEAQMHEVEHVLIVEGARLAIEKILRDRHGHASSKS